MKEKLRKRIRKPAVIILSSVFSVAVAAAVGIFLYLYGMVNKVQYSPGYISKIVSQDSATASENSPKAKIDSVEKQIADNLQSSSSTLIYNNNVLNILLIGTDNRADVGGSRSDSMILISINQKTSKIVMTSFLRDIYLSIPGHGENRLNAAYAFGGAPLLMETIHNNFKVEVDKYVKVDFFAFIKIIDELGGVHIDVSVRELPVLNSYVREINKLQGLPVDDGILQHEGKELLLTGKQALGYCRIRYVGNDDYERTQRQRAVLMALYAKLIDQNLVRRYEILNMLMPDLTTNLSRGELISMLLSASEYRNYKLQQDRIPIDGSQQNLVIRRMDVLGIDFEKNIEELKSKIYR